MKDVTIIGAGVIGCAIAREMSKYALNIQVLEKDYDIANGTSKANSGIVHAGEDPKPGTLKAQMNIEGNKMFDQLSKELKFPFKRNGSMVLSFKIEDRVKLEGLKQRGICNGVPEESMHILNREEARQIEPNLSEKVAHALYLETGGIVGPYEMTIALAENAYENGVDFQLDTEVMGIKKLDGVFHIETTKGEYTSKIVINAAGVYADKINNQISGFKYNIIPRKGEYLLLDKKQVATCTLFQLPTAMGKGVLVTPTCHGNVIVGPTAEDIPDKEDVTTTRAKLDELVEKAALTIDGKQLGGVITSFAGVRAHEEKGDFIIGESEDIDGFINVLGIESPGLTSAPAIAKKVADLVVIKLGCNENSEFNPVRNHPMPFGEATLEEKQRMIQQNAKYGNIICRCEMVTAAEILRAIDGPLGATTIDGIKRRTRAGMGRCQGGFCLNKIVEILAQQLGKSVEEVRKNSAGSQLLVGDLKGKLEE